MSKKIPLAQREKFLKKILAEKIGKTKIIRINKDENILSSGIIDSMDFADIFFSLEKKFDIKIPFLKVFGKNNNITLNNLNKCLKIKK